VCSSDLNNGGIQVNTGSIQVDSTVVRTAGNQTIGGTKAFSSTIIGSINGNSVTTSDSTVIRNNVIGDQSISGILEQIASGGSIGGYIISKSSTSWLFTQTGGSRGDLQFYIGRSAAGAGDPLAFDRWQLRYTFKSDGEAFAVRWNNTSDYRLKNNITKLTNSKEKIKNLNPVSYEFLTSPGKTYNGFIAHELEEVIPNAVSGTKDAVDEDGKPIYQAISSTDIVAELASALKEVIIENEEMKSKISELENTLKICLEKINNLETKIN
jgi:hypothetical protein